MTSYAGITLPLETDFEIEAVSFALTRYREVCREKVQAGADYPYRNHLQVIDGLFARNERLDHYSEPLTIQD